MRWNCSKSLLVKFFSIFISMGDIEIIVPNSVEPSNQQPDTEETPVLVPVTVPVVEDLIEPPNQETGDDDSASQTSSCRICFNTQYTENSLIAPCSCKGSIAYVHQECLERWLNLKNSVSCDLCFYEFNVKMEPRYKMLESIPVWLSRRARLVIFIFDLAVLTLMSILILGMIFILVYNIKNIYEDETLQALVPVWYITLLSVGAVFWALLYCLLLFMFVNAQIRPWYLWWHAQKKICLLIWLIKFCFWYCFFRWPKLITTTKRLVKITLLFRALSSTKIFGGW